MHRFLRGVVFFITEEKKIRLFVFIPSIWTNMEWIGYFSHFQKGSLVWDFSSINLCLKSSSEQPCSNDNLLQSLSFKTPFSFSWLAKRLLSLTFSKICVLFFFDPGIRRISIDIRNFFDFQEDSVFWDFHEFNHRFLPYIIYILMVRWHALCTIPHDVAFLTSEENTVYSIYNFLKNIIYDIKKTIIFSICKILWLVLKTQKAVMKYVFRGEERTSENTHVMAGAFFCRKTLQSLHLTYLFSPDGVSTGRTGHFSLKPSCSISLRNHDASFPLEP